MNNIYMPTKHAIKKITKLQDIEWLFEVEFDRADECRPGQFIQISIPMVGEAPLSITKINRETKTIEFLIRKVGKVTNELFALNVGDHFYLRGPFGTTFELDKYASKDLIVISGGSGLAPVRPIVQEFIGNDNFHLISGFRDNKGVLFLDEVREWQKSQSNITITLDKNIDADPTMDEGLVTKYIESTLAKVDINNLVVVVVGPPIMMHFACLELAKHGVSDESIIVSFERNMSCAVGKCGHCKIDETYVCLEGPVFSYTKGKKLLD